jgi:putative SOS response-associated peptidase YedK
MTVRFIENDGSGHALKFHVKKEPEDSEAHRLLNIRSERILDDTASYWYKIRNRRCLVPVRPVFLNIASSRV